jgi:hypothetical protein
MQDLTYLSGDPERIDELHAAGPRAREPTGSHVDEGLSGTPGDRHVGPEHTVGASADQNRVERTRLWPGGRVRVDPLPGQHVVPGPESSAPRHPQPETDTESSRQHQGREGADYFRMPLGTGVPRVLCEDAALDITKRDR